MNNVGRNGQLSKITGSRMAIKSYFAAAPHELICRDHVPGMNNAGIGLANDIHI